MAIGLGKMFGFDIPENFKLVAQMPFGGIVSEPDKKEKEDISYNPFVEMSYIGTDKIEFPLKKIKLLKGYNIEFNLIIELYADKMFINAENIVVDGEKYILP